MRLPGDRWSTPLHVTIGLLVVAVFLADLQAVLGIAVWVLYFVPLALSAFAWSPTTPLWAGLVSSSLLAVGYYYDWNPSGPAPHAFTNRSFAFVSLWAVAILARTVVATRLKVARQDWVKNGQTKLALLLQGERSSAELGERVLGFLTSYLEAPVGAFHVVGPDGRLRRVAGHALTPGRSAPAEIGPGEGLVGQAARDPGVRHVRDLPAGYLDIASGVGAHAPRELVLSSCRADDVAHAVIELGALRAFDATDLELVGLVSEPVAIALRSALLRARQQELLEETQQQAEELQTQQEELRVANEELESQTRALQESQQRLENQQVELEQINAHLEEQASTLEAQKADLERGRVALQRANDYKSEFLANMSHELRTPLNSTLILAKLLADNRAGNLTAEQVNYARTISSAGNDLLTLINDILDLAKIEAGKLELRVEVVPLRRVLDELATTFKPLAQERRIELGFQLDERAPATIETDPTRLAQVLKNLVGNGIKFTERGGVTVTVSPTADGRVAFAIKDTGIGIAPDQHEVIFEAFRQADGTTNRKYGGTGLGLSISRDLTRLLRGELTLESTPGRGSTFTLIVPAKLGDAPAARLRPQPRPVAPPSPAPAPAPPPPDGGRRLLIVEDDPSFAAILADLARELGFEPILAATGEDGLEQARRRHPSAIILDVGLPDRSGLSVLDALKHDSATRHVPVHVVSVEDHTRTALELGAVGYELKPVARERLVEALRGLEARLTQGLRRVLVIEDDRVQRESMTKLLEGDDVRAVAVGTAAEAMAKLRAESWDCVVLDLALPDATGFQLLESISAEEGLAIPPVIIYTGRALSQDEEQRLRRYSRSIIIKGARSPERLLDEVTLFLHQVEAKLPPERQRMLREVRDREAIFEGRRILVVEDDARNIFALSRVLETKGAQVEIARNGREALEHLERQPGVDLVLMDIMMPEMDGIEATRELRRRPASSKLPVIALTAKAMRDDREKCLAAGANDYIAKPLDVDKLLSLLRVWMPR